MAVRFKDAHEHLSQEQILECTATLRGLPWEHPSCNSQRAEKMAASDSRFRANSFILGKNPLTGDLVWPMNEEKNREHYRALRKVFKVLSALLKEKDPDFVFHQITINKNLKCKKHRDQHNAGPSYIVGFGEFLGGEMVLWPEDNTSRGFAHNVKHRFVKFNGATQYHETSAFTGTNGRPAERITCVFYSAGPKGIWRKRVDVTALSDSRNLVAAPPVTPGQRAAIDAPFAQPLAIIAGAGCGKTLTLIRRIKALVEWNPPSPSSSQNQKTIIDPASVLVLTFSRKAKAELRERLSGAGLQRVQCLTFHGFALRLHREFGNVTEQQAVPLTDANQKKMVHECLDKWFDINEQQEDHQSRRHGVEEAAAVDARREEGNKGGASLGAQREHGAAEGDEGGEPTTLAQRRVDRSQDRLMKRLVSIISRAKGFGFRVNDVAPAAAPSSMPPKHATDLFEDQSPLLGCSKFVFQEYTRALRSGGKVEPVRKASLTDDTLSMHRSDTNSTTGNSNSVNVDSSTICRSRSDEAKQLHRSRGKVGRGTVGRLILDFEDLIPSATAILRRPQVLTAAKERYQHCFVDEFQDTSLAQFELIRLLWGPEESQASHDDQVGGNIINDKEMDAQGKGLEPSMQINRFPSQSLTTTSRANINALRARIDEPLSSHPLRSLTVVGDDDQMIYGWRDAMRNAFGTFRDCFGAEGEERTPCRDRRGVKIMTPESQATSWCAVPPVPRARFVTLDVNFRTRSALILRAACNVVQKIDRRHRARRHTLKPASHHSDASVSSSSSSSPLQSTCISAGVDEPLRVCTVPSLSDEADLVCARIIGLLYGLSTENQWCQRHQGDYPGTSAADVRSGRRVKPSNVAILCRTGVGVNLVRKRLADMGIASGALDNISATGHGMGSSAAFESSADNSDGCDGGLSDHNNDGDGENDVLAGQRFLQRRPIADVVAVLNLLVDELDDEAFLRVLRSKVVRGLGKQFEEWLVTESVRRGTREHIASPPLPLPLIGTARLVLSEVDQTPPSQQSSKKSTGGSGALKKGQIENLRSFMQFLGDLWALLCFGKKVSPKNAGREEIATLNTMTVVHQTDLSMVIEAISQRLSSTSFPAEKPNVARPTTVSETLQGEIGRAVESSTSRARNIDCLPIKKTRISGFERPQKAGVFMSAAELSRASYSSLSSLSTSHPTKSPFMSAMALLQTECQNDALGSSRMNDTYHDQEGDHDINRAQKEEKEEKKEKKNYTRKKKSDDDAAQFFKTLRILAERFTSSRALGLSPSGNAAALSPSLPPLELGGDAMYVLRDFLDALQAGELSLAGTPARICMQRRGEEGGARHTPLLGGRHGGKVTLTTIHKAKGLEWDHVFVVGCFDGGLPSLRGDDTLLEDLQGGLRLDARTRVPSTRNVDDSAGLRRRSNGHLQQSLLRSDEERMEEERRLFHVAVTRARESCTLLCPREDGYGNQVSPSRFIDDIQPKCLRLSLVTGQRVAWELQYASNVIEEERQAVTLSPITSTSLVEADKCIKSLMSSSSTSSLSSGSIVLDEALGPLKITIPPVPHRRRPLCPRHHVALSLVRCDSDSNAVLLQLACPAMLTKMGKDGFYDQTCGHRQIISNWLLLPQERNDTGENNYINGDISSSENSDNSKRKMNKNDSIEKRAVKKARHACSEDDAMAKETDVYGNLLGGYDKSGNDARKPRSKSPPRTISSFFTMASQAKKSRSSDVEDNCAIVINSDNQNNIKSRKNGKHEHSKGDLLDASSQVTNELNVIDYQATCPPSPPPLSGTGKGKLEKHRTVSMAAAEGQVKSRSRLPPASRWSKAQRKARAQAKIAPYKLELWRYVKESIEEKNQHRWQRCDQSLMSNEISNPGVMTSLSSSKEIPSTKSMKRRGRGSQPQPLLKGQQLLSATGFFRPKPPQEEKQEQYQRQNRNDKTCHRSTAKNEIKYSASTYLPGENNSRLCETENRGPREPSTGNLCPLPVSKYNFYKSPVAVPQHLMDPPAHRQETNMKRAVLLDLHDSNPQKVNCNRERETSSSRLSLSRQRRQLKSKKTRPGIDNIAHPIPTRTDNAKDDIKKNQFSND